MLQFSFMIFLFIFWHLNDFRFFKALNILGKISFLFALSSLKSLFSKFSFLFSCIFFGLFLCISYFLVNCILFSFFSLLLVSFSSSLFLLRIFIHRMIHSFAIISILGKLKSLTHQLILLSLFSLKSFLHHCSFLFESILVLIHVHFIHWLFHFVPIVVRKLLLVGALL